MMNIRLLNHRILPWVSVRAFSTGFKSNFGVTPLAAATTKRSSSSKSQQKLSVEQKKQVAKSKKQLQSLKLKLSKEKSLFSKLQKKYRDESQSLKAKEKERKQKAKSKISAIKEKERQKKLLAAATKPFRRLSAYNFFIKENTSSNTSLKEATDTWNILSENEKDRYKRLADSFNDEKLKIYTPKPKAPAGGFALYVKQNYYNDGRTFAEINKELASEWGALSNAEKQKYSLSEASKKEFAQKLQVWTDQRLKLYRESRSSASS